MAKKAKKSKNIKKRAVPKKLKVIKKNGSLSMLATALKMEEKGKAFYEMAIVTTQNEIGREIFSYLMNEEVVHVGRIRKIFASLKEGRGWNDSWKDISIRPKDLNFFFKDLADKRTSNIKASTSDIEALDIGIKFEHKAVEFYRHEFSKAKDQLEKEFVEMMVLEEKKHCEILDEMKTYLTDPEGWGSKFDKLSYDGG